MSDFSWDRVLRERGLLDDAVDEPEEGAVEIAPEATLETVTADESPDTAQEPEPEAESQPEPIVTELPEAEAPPESAPEPVVAEAPAEEVEVSQSDALPEPEAAEATQPSPEPVVALEASEPEPLPEPVKLEVVEGEAGGREPKGRAKSRAAADKKRLGDLLIQHKLVSQAQMEAAMTRQKETRELLGQILVSMGFITEKRLLQALAHQQGVSPWHLESEAPSPEALAKLAHDVCQRYQVLPVALRHDLLVLAMRNPADIDAIDFVRNVTGLRIEPVLADETRLADVIETAYGVRESRETASVDNLVQQALQDFQTDAKTAKKQERAVLTEADTRPVIGLVNQIVSDAIRMRASDIHLEPRYDRMEIRYRLDGRLLKVRTIPHELIPMLTTRIKIMAEVDIVEHRLPQDGRISVSSEKGELIDLRVSVLPNVHGQRIVMRVLDKSVGLKKLDQLGFDPENLALFRNLVSRPYGMFLVTGPTGSGKTTTLYAALAEVQTEGNNVMTCEDPVEYDIEGINQSQVFEKVGLTFAQQLRAILRQDPDIVLVGEIRDQETAETAIRAALTGHLVLSTLHCNDAPSAVPRLLDMGVDPYLLSTAIIGTMGQRLLRTLCPHCRESRPPDADDAQTLKAVYGLSNVEQLWYPVGCERCHGTGYRSRMAVHEILPVTEEISKLIAERATVEQLREAAAFYGYQSMQQDAVNRVLKGETSLEEAKRLLAFDSIERRSEPRGILRQAA